MTHTQQKLLTLPPAYSTFNDEIKRVYQFDVARLLCELVDWLSQRPPEHNFPLPAHPAEAALIAINLPPTKMVGYGEPLPEGSAQQVALAVVVSILQWDLMERKKPWPRLSEASRHLYLALEKFSLIEPEMRTWVEQARKSAARYNPELPGVQLTLEGASLLEEVFSLRHDFSEALRDTNEVGRELTRGPFGASSLYGFESHLKTGRKPKEVLTSMEHHLRVCGYRDAQIAELINDLGPSARAGQRVGERRRQRKASKIAA